MCMQLLYGIYVYNVYYVWYRDDRMDEDIVKPLIEVVENAFSKAADEIETLVIHCSVLNHAINKNAGDRHYHKSLLEQRRKAIEKVRFFHTDDDM